VVSIGYFDRVIKAGSVGQPIPETEVRIVDENDKEVPTGGVGELIVKGPNISPGYYNMPEETANTFKNGWLYTGDLARMDENGYLYIVERKKDLIIRGGFNIYPRDVEEILHRHPAVQEAAVIGMPDPIMGEDVKAFIVLAANTTASEQEIIDFCRQHLSKDKCPKFVEFLNNLPKSTIGKVLRKDLRKLA
jgi:long-chain acyl-CoA synthetase